ALVESGEARGGYRKLAMTHADGRRWIVVGLGRADEFDAERARGASAAALGRAREAGSRSLCWAPPVDAADEVAGLVEGAVLADQVSGLEVEVEGRDGLEGRGMGAFAAVAQGSYQEPALITLRYDGPSAGGPVLGLVGKAVTFDTGGISIKPAQKMHEMKFD